jgi:hypothetical protein
MDLEALDLLSIISPRAAIVGAGVMLVAGGVVYASLPEDPDSVVIAAAVASGADDDEIAALRERLHRQREAARYAASEGSSYDAFAAASARQDQNWDSGTFNEGASDYSGE